MALTRYANKDLLTMPDCQGLMENGRCRWLSIPRCIGASCGYYQQHRSEEKAAQRLCALDEEKQEYIAQKYYGGFRPWKKCAVKTRR